MPEDFTTQFHHVPNLDPESCRHCITPRALNRCFLRSDVQGGNCERNYDDCLLNPCPEAYSCVDGINAVSCLPPATDAVPLATAATNITLDSASRVPALALNMTSTAEKYTGVFSAEPSRLPD